MCGIWGVILMNSTSSVDRYGKMRVAFNNIKHRGPDYSSITNYDFNNNKSVLIGFHRLAIRDVSLLGNQPFTMTVSSSRQIITVINGEIYNYSNLVEKYDLNDKLTSKSDCEVIPLLYLKLGISRTMENIRGEFALAIIDINVDPITKETSIKTILARDHLGIRPLFYSDNNDGLYFCSEIKGIHGINDNMVINHFTPGTYSIFLDNEPENKYCYYKRRWPINYDNNNLDLILKNIRISLKRSVKQMVVSDRPIGALLSGGLDSSLIVSIAAKYLKKIGKRLNTFSIGMPGSTDREYAVEVSKFCDTDHTHIELATEDFLGAIDEVIEKIETYDITTIRASVGQYLVGKWIRDNTDIKVILIGDGSDELTCGYMYFHKAPNPIYAHLEAQKLLSEIHYYDVLRADRGIATNGLEARVPFLDREFVDMYMNITPDLRIPISDPNRGNVRIEKWLLRKAFDNGKTLPNIVLWRKKEAFSDGVSSANSNKSWYQTIQTNIKTSVGIKLYTHLPPVSSESAYYREVFTKFYPNMDHILKKYWLPNWYETTEPSARTLDVY